MAPSRVQRLRVELLDWMPDEDDDLEALPLDGAAAHQQGAPRRRLGEVSKAALAGAITGVLVTIVIAWPRSRPPPMVTAKPHCPAGQSGSVHLAADQFLLETRGTWRTSQRRYPVPPRATLSFQTGAAERPGFGNLGVLAASEMLAAPRERRGVVVLGFDWEVDSVQAHYLARLNVTNPVPDGVSLTFGLIAKRPLLWMGLGVGETDETTTTDSRHRLVVSRPQPTTWILRASPREGRGPSPWFTGGTLVLRTCDERDPWGAFALAYNATSAQGWTRAALTLGDPLSLTGYNDSLTLCHAGVAVAEALRLPPPGQGEPVSAGPQVSALHELFAASRGGATSELRSLGRAVALSPRPARALPSLARECAQLHPQFRRLFGPT